MFDFTIETLSHDLDEEIKYKIDHKTKPLGSLGQLEKIAFQVARIQQTLTPRLTNPTIVLVGADHGICAEGVSPCPQEITWQQMINFSKGGGGIGLFCNQYNINLKVVDAGVNYAFSSEENILNYKFLNGTRNFLHEPALTRAECEQAMANGAEIVRILHSDGCNVIGFGEMGIGNTSPASILMSIICNIPLADCVGPGSGHDVQGVSKKLLTLSEAIKNNGVHEDPVDLLACYGGLEIATIVGGMLQAAALKMLVLNDGFIITSALLVAQQISPAMLEYVIFSHHSKEGGHAMMIDYMKGEPVLNLDLRLGEGTGAALAYPIIEGAISMLNDMTSFEEAKITDTTGKGQRIL